MKCTRETVTSCKITIKDIAKRAGVSTATVSNAFSGKGNLSEAKRKEIVAIAKELEYVPSPAAKALYKGNVKIAVVMPSEPKVLVEHFRRGFLRAMKKQPCTSMECTFLTYDTVNEYFRSAVETVIEEGFDGVILSYPKIMEQVNAPLFERLNGLGVPFVSMIEKLSLLRCCAHIGVDSECGGRLAADLLGSMLSKEDGIAVFTATQKDAGVHKEYIDGFTEELGFYGMKVASVYTNCEDSKVAYETAKECFSKKDYPKGIFVTPYSARAVADAAKDAGVIGSVHIIGVDTVDDNLSRLLSGDILALIDQRQELQAERALTETVHRLLADGVKSEGTVTPNIVTRGKYVGK